MLKGQKIPHFEGKKEKFAQWSYTFLSICAIAGCKDALVSDTYDVPASDLELNDLQEVLLKRRKANATAYAMLTITVKDNTGFQAVRNGVTKKLPDGSAREAWKNLLKIYQPKSTTQKYELEQKFNDCKLEKETKSPDEWFTELEHIRVLLKEDHSFEISDEKMIQQIVYNVKPKAYDTLIFALKRDLQYKSDKLELERVKDEFRQVFGTLSKTKSPDTALAATKHGKKYKGTCQTCGAKGHKRADCWDNDKNKDKRPTWYKSPDERKKSEGNTANVTTTKKTETSNTPATANTATGGNGKATYYCDHCKKNGHTEDRCIAKLKETIATLQTGSNTANTANVALLCYETCMLTTDSESAVTPNTFIADSGASTHMVHSRHLLTDFKEHINEVKIGDKTMVQSLGSGTFKGFHINKDGKEINVTLNDVILVPSLWVNLFSVTKATSNNECKVICEDNLITVQSNQHKLHFATVLPHGDGKIMATEFYTNTNCANLVLQKTTYKDFHNKLGHPNQQKVIDTAKYYGINLSDTDRLHPCVDCGLSKIRVKNFGHTTENKSKAKGERIFIDISSVNNVSFGGAKFWLLIQDEFTGFLWSYFLSAKSDLSITMQTWINLFQKKYNTTIKYIRCDNSGENQKFQKDIEADETLNPIFEFTAPYTPQQNGKIERKFATLWGKVRAMLNSAKLPWNLRNRLWAQCANLATQLENILVTNNTTPYKLMNDSDPSWINNLHSFGELAIVHDGANSQISGKLKDKGLITMFVGYPPNHSGEVCQFLKLGTNTLIASRTAIFIHKTYQEYFNLKSTDVSTLVNPELDNPELELEDIIEEPFENLVEDIRDPEMVDYPEIIAVDNDTGEYLIPQRGIRELRNLTTYYNPDPFQYVHAATLATFSKLFDVCLQATVYDGNPDPKTFTEAKQSPDWPNWWEAMCTEFKNMHEKQVWTIIPRSSLPSNRKVIGNRWVYVQKDDGRYRARTVAKGFTQIPGKDFQENHSPVVNDTTFHTLLVLKILLGLEAGQFDIETAFLYGDLEEKLWMDLPEGYIQYVEDLIKNGKSDEIPISKEHNITNINEKDHCCELGKAIYGLVQAARQWWKKFKQVIQKLGYKASLADPCLFVKDDPKKSFIIIYVDDGGIFGTKENIKEVLTELGKTFKVKDLGKLENFIGCKIIENTQKDTIWIHQPKLIKHLKQTFGKMVESVREYKTPAAPKTTILRPLKDEPLISSDDQKLFRSGVGMLLYLVKHSRPDIQNAVRELSKVADGATQAHWNAMLRTIKYVLHTEFKALKLHPIKKGELFNLEGLSDSNFAEDKDTRTSVYGYVLYFCGAPIATKSKLGRSVTQSSTEAEYFAISEIAKEVLFTKQLLDTIGIEIELPIIIRVDNVGAIFLANNFSVSQKTKHIDIRAHFIREYIEDGILKLVFIRSEDNDSDIFTKNLSEDLFNKHADKMTETVENT
jgi:hypothetical protein